MMDIDDVTQAVDVQTLVEHSCEEQDGTKATQPPAALQSDRDQFAVLKLAAPHTDFAVLYRELL